MYFVSFLRGLFETILSLEPEGVRIVYKRPKVSCRSLVFDGQ